jgi:hypothetical protein
MSYKGELMNKRQAKKHKKKMELFAVSFVSPYKELKEFDRSYHEFVLMCNRKKKRRHVFDLSREFKEEFNDE